MTNTSHHLKNNLREDGDDALDKYLEKAEKEAESPVPDNRSGKFVLILVFVIAGLFLFNELRTKAFSAFPVYTTTATNTASQDLLTRMGNRMVEMGYMDLTRDDLRELRGNGVTATYISNVRALGYSDLTLDEAVQLAKAGASSAFIAMMIELGYTLDVDDIVRLKDVGVTAHFTSTVHDLGYRDVSIDQLIRMRRIGVSPDLIRQLQAENGDDITMEEIIRYRISNQ